MRHGLLRYVCCPACSGALACYPAHEVATPISPFVAAMPERNREVEIESGLLVCRGCGRWFPIVETLPELLPDYLRDAARERPILDALAPALPGDVRSRLRNPEPQAAPAADAGAHYKRAEIGIVSKLANPGEFFGPGHSAPFNPANTDFTFYLLSLFGNMIRLLGITDRSSHSAVVIDSGCGYAWTSEWLAKSGIETIGVDICRAYLEVGVRRMGPSRPHLIVADVENLPIAAGVADAVLAYESFHHIPDRARAMRGYARALKDGGTVVLAEPGEAHEHAEISVEMMDKYGILEKGMELEDVAQYAAGLPFDAPEQMYIIHASGSTLDEGLNRPSAWRHSAFDGNVFRLRKRAGGNGSRPAAQAATPGVRDWQAEQRRLIAELHDVKVVRDRLDADLSDARHTVAMMRTSVFWRARHAWVRLASLFGSERGNV